VFERIACTCWSLIHALSVERLMPVNMPAASTLINSEPFRRRDRSRLSHFFHSSAVVSDRDLPGSLHVQLLICQHQNDECRVVNLASSSYSSLIIHRFRLPIACAHDSKKWYDIHGKAVKNS